MREQFLYSVLVKIRVGWNFPYSPLSYRAFSICNIDPRRFYAMHWMQGSHVHSLPSSARPVRQSAMRCPAMRRRLPRMSHRVRDFTTHPVPRTAPNFDQRIFRTHTALIPSSRPAARERDPPMRLRPSSTHGSGSGPGAAAGSGFEGRQSAPMRVSRLPFFFLRHAVPRSFYQ